MIKAILDGLAAAALWVLLFAGISMMQGCMTAEEYARYMDAMDRMQENEQNRRIRQMEYNYRNQQAIQQAERNNRGY